LRLREQLKPVTGTNSSKPRTYRTKHGTTSTMRTGNIGGSGSNELTPIRVIYPWQKLRN
jgi:hypothetical protein